MSEESPTPEPAEDTPRKKPAARKTSAKSTTAAKKPAARKATTGKAAAQKTTRKATGAAKSADTGTGAVKTETPAKAEPAPDTASKKAATPEQEPRQAGDKNDYDASKMVEDLKGRDWPKIIQRALLMFFFGVLGWITLSLAFFLAAAQVVFTIFVGEANPALTRLIKQGGNYIRDVLDYLSFGSDECPFPFGRRLPDAD